MGYEETAKASDAAKIRHIPNKLAIFLAVVATNCITFFLIAGRVKHRVEIQHSAGDRLLLSVPVSELLSQLNYTQSELLRTQRELFAVQKQWKESVKQSDGLLSELTQAVDLIRAVTAHGMSLAEEASNREQDPWARFIRTQQLVGELREFLSPRKLPLGWSGGLASDTLISPVGHPCALNSDDLKEFMDYDPGKECPDDQNLAQRLLLHGCEPLPRRRCIARTPPNFTDPYPLPTSLWAMPPDENIYWAAYTCKSFSCLNERPSRHVSGDCLDCFELGGKEAGRWVGRSGSGTHFTVEEVLAMKNGSIRIGLDIGGGTASFAVRMKEQDVTIVTTTMNLDGPFNNMIALRGVVPLYLTVSQRFPFFDNTLDIVHSMHVLSNWIPTDTLEFLLFDIDRILRPGGIFWLDHFFCVRPQLAETYLPLIEKLGYKKLKWAIGDKLDRGADKQEVYLSAILEKPYKR